MASLIGIDGYKAAMSFEDTTTLGGSVRVSKSRITDTLSRVKPSFAVICSRTGLSQVCSAFEAL
jgi:hypothetical protein